MGTWLHSNIVFDFEFEWDKRAVVAGTFCREFTGHIYWHAALHSCSSSSYCVILSSLTVRTHTTCICFGGEVELCVKTVCANRRALIACSLFVVKSEACIQRKTSAIFKLRRRELHVARSKRKSVN